MPSIAAVRDTVTSIYNEPEARPELVKVGLEKTGLDKMLGPKVVERVAGWSTRAGVAAEVAELQEAAKPYMEMSKKELANEVNEKIIIPAREKATPYVEPYVAPIVAKGMAKKDAVKEVVAPYIQKGVETKDAVLKDERVQKAVADLKDKFSAVRERPAEVARELGSNALDLIKYEKVTEYREYVCSEKFVADTTKLVKEDLPQLAKDAYDKGATKVQAASTVLTAELGHATTIVAEAWKKGREEQPEVRSWEALRGLAQTLIAEIQTGLVGRIEENGLDKKYAEITARLTEVFGLGKKDDAEPPAAEEADAEATEVFEDAKETPAEEKEEEEEPEEEEPEEEEPTPTSM